METLLLLTNLSLSTFADEIVAMSFQSTYRQPDRGTGWEKRASRALLHDVTDQLKKAEDQTIRNRAVSASPHGDPPFSEAEFIPALAIAVLCRGQSDFDSVSQPPSGCLLCYTTPRARNKYFPMLIKVDLLDTGHPALPTVSCRLPATTNSSYTPLPRGCSKFAGPDRFWQMLKAKEPDSSDNEAATGNKMATGTVLLCVFYRLYIEEHDTVPTPAKLATFLLQENIKREYMNMAIFYESYTNLTAACKNCINGPASKGLPKKSYVWHPHDFGNEDEMEVARNIDAALLTGELLDISMAADRGMTKSLFRRLEKIRRMYQDWRSRRTGSSKVTHKEFKKWYYRHQHGEGFDGDTGEDQDYELVNS